MASIVLGEPVLDAHPVSPPRRMLASNDGASMLFVHYQAILNDRTSAARTVEIGRTSGGRIADYIALERSPEGKVVAQAELRTYPRWVEHVSGLAARCTWLLAPSPSDDSDPTLALSASIEAARVEIGFGSHREGMRRCLERIEYGRNGFSPRILVARESFPSFDYPAPAELPGDRGAVVSLLALAAWGKTTIPETPIPLDVPVHHDGVPYVRLSDIPEPARTEFDRRMQGATVPALGCAFAWDWERFVAGI